jgi:hypothetical protein
VRSGACPQRVSATTSLRIFTPHFSSRRLMPVFEGEAVSEAWSCVTLMLPPNTPRLPPFIT